MCARRVLGRLLILTVTTMVAACQPTQSMSARPTGMPSVTYEITPAPTSILAPTPVLQSESGVRLTARIDTICLGEAGPRTACLQPYAGEFVITTLNGAEVTRVVTNQEGQATVELPPGNYILGVRTEEIYPFAAPVTVNVVADRYESISFSLDSGLWQHAQSK